MPIELKDSQDFSSDQLKFDSIKQVLLDPLVCMFSCLICRFYVEEDRDGSWQIAFGNYDVISTAHNMRFESTLEDTSESNDNFPFSWKITNIDFEDDKNED